MKAMQQHQTSHSSVLNNFDNSAIISLFLHSSQLIPALQFYLSTVLQLNTSLSLWYNILLYLSFIYNHMTPKKKSYFRPYIYGFKQGQCIIYGFRFSMMLFPSITLYNQELTLHTHTIWPSASLAIYVTDLENKRLAKNTAFH